MILFDSYANAILGEELLKKLDNCPQDPKYHSEGSVLTHIKLVFSACEKHDDINLLVCALFHDLGKLDTTRVYLKKDGIRIHSISHELYFGKYLTLLKDKADQFFAPFNIDWEAVEFVCSEHMRGHELVKGSIKKLDKIEYFTNSQHYPLLMKFLKADNEGRKMHSKGKPYLLILVGIPGSGKTTWRRKFVEKFPSYVTVCPDDLRKELTGDISNISKDGEVWKKAFYLLDSNLSFGRDIIFDSTACSRKTRKSIESIGIDHGAIVIYKFFETPVEEAKKRIKDDITNGVDRSHVPEYVVDRMQTGFVEALKDASISQDTFYANILFEKEGWQWA